MGLGHYLPAIYCTRLDSPRYCTVFDYQADTNHILACVYDYKVRIDSPLVADQIRSQMSLVGIPPSLLFDFLS